MAASSPEISSPSELTRRERRSRQGSGHLDALTGLRGFAALTVVFVHCSGLTAYPWFGIHAYGPIALFVLSGYLLIQPWSMWMLGAGPRPDVAAFVRRRTWRIFPAYLVVLLAAAMLLPGTRPLGTDGWLRALTLTSTSAADGLRPGMEHTWSLGTELSWYAVVPLVGVGVAWLGRKVWPTHPARPYLCALALAGALSLAWRYLVMHHVEDLGRQITFPLWLPAFLFCFVAGAAVAHLGLVSREGRGRARLMEFLAARSWLIGCVAVGGILVGNSHLGGAWTFTPSTFGEILVRTVACTIVALVLLIGVTVGDPRSALSRVLAMPWLVATGRWSYGIYLWHMPAMSLLAREVSIGPGFTGLLLWISTVLAVAIPLGALTHVFVEMPAIAWSKRTPTQQPS